jgi:hypothetical protein
VSLSLTTTTTTYIAFSEPSSQKGWEGGFNYYSGKAAKILASGVWAFDGTGSPLLQLCWTFITTRLFIHTRTGLGTMSNNSSGSNFGMEADHHQ